MNILIYLLMAFFNILLFIVGVYNGGEVMLELKLWQVGPVPLGALIATAAVFGMAFASLIGIIDGIKIRITNRQLRRQLNRLEEDVDALRLKLARHEGPLQDRPAGDAPSGLEPPPS